MVNKDQCLGVSHALQQWIMVSETFLKNSDNLLPTVGSGTRPIS